MFGCGSLFNIFLLLLLTDFYDEAFALVGDLTTKSISPEMWGMLTTIHDVFKQDAMDAFTDLMPALHNYITVDTPTFLSNPQYIEVILDICKTVSSIQNYNLFTK